MASAEDLYRIRVVRQDLEFLRDKWDNSIDEPSLRRSSNVLRGLLVDGNLGRAWRALGLERQPIILAPDLDSMLTGIEPQRVEFAPTGATLSADSPRRPDRAWSWRGSRSLNRASFSLREEV